MTFLLYFMKGLVKLDLLFLIRCALPVQKSSPSINEIVLWWNTGNNPVTGLLKTVFILCELGAGSPHLVYIHPWNLLHIQIHASADLNQDDNPKPYDSMTYLIKTKYNYKQSEGWPGQNGFKLWSQKSVLASLYINQTKQG